MDIKRVISERGLSQVELAKRMLDTESKEWQDMKPEDQQKKLKSTVSYVSQLISGKSDPSMKKLDMLAQVIGCQRWEFFRDEIEAAGITFVVGAQQQASAETEPSQALPEAEPTAPQTPAAEPKDDEELPFSDDKPVEQEQAQQAEEVKAVRFTYGCPHCGASMQVCISPE